MNAPTAPTAWEQNRASLTPETMLRRAMQFVNEEQLNISPSKARRLVRSHLREIGATDDEKSLLRYLLSYADPTGETAARNVDGGARR